MGINSLIAYYFKTTRFCFLDECDFEILVDLANMCGIQVNVDKNSIEEIYEQFLSKLDDFTEDTWCKGIVGTIIKSGPIFTDKKFLENIWRLQIQKNFTRQYYPRQTAEIVDELIVFLDEMIGDDLAILSSKLPNLDLLKKYMTLKKIVLCKTPYNNNFYENIPSGTFYDSFDDWSTDTQDRGIYPQTYEFIKEMENKFKELNDYSLQEDSTRPVGHQLIKMPQY